MRPVGLVRGTVGAVGLVAALGACGKQDEVKVVPAGTSVFVVSDAHYYAPTLGTTGAAFDAYAAREGRLVRESAALFAAVRRDIEKARPPLLLMPGDLTSDGEVASHQELAAQLAAIQAAGTRVLVVPGNHDLDNPNASSYGEAGATPVPSLSRGEFATMYADFGYAAALDRDVDSLSYVAEPVPGLRILALDSTLRAADTPTFGGHIGDGTLAWAKRQIAAARAGGVQIVGMMHHELLEHFNGQAASFPGYVVDDHERVRRELAGAGLQLMLTGHFHATDVASESGLFDVATGSIDSYPCAYRTLDLGLRGVNVLTETVMAQPVVDGKAFPVWAYTQLADSIRTGTTALLGQAPYNVAPGTAGDLAGLAVDALIAHYVGDERIPPDTLVVLEAAEQQAAAAERQAATVLKSLWTDTGPADRDVYLELTP